MIGRGQLHFGQDGGAITPHGLAHLASLGLDLSPDTSPRSGAVTFCRPCLDWSERRPHVAGAVGRALYLALVQKGWIREPGIGRAVAVTPLGISELRRHFGLALS